MLIQHAEGGQVNTNGVPCKFEIVGGSEKYDARHFVLFLNNLFYRFETLSVVEQYFDERVLAVECKPILV